MIFDGLPGCVGEFWMMVDDCFVMCGCFCEVVEAV